MKRSMFVVLLFMAAVSAYAGERSVGLVDFDAYYFVGPVCLPGDPCGSGVTGVNGPQAESWITNFAGPVCLPGDPCGSGGKPMSEVLSKS